MPNIGFSVSSLSAGGQSLFSPARQSRVKEDVFARADPDARGRYEEALDISRKLAQGAKDAQNFATTKDLEAKKQRLKLLKMLAGSATDPRTIRAIAREVAEIARSLGHAAPAGGGMMQAQAAAAEAVSGGADAAAADPAATAVAGEGEAMPGTATAAPVGDGSADSIKDQVRQLLQLARKILEKLRSIVLPGSREAEEVEKANREILKTAAAFGLSLDDGSASSASGTAGGEVATTASLSLTVLEVVSITTIDIKV